MAITHKSSLTQPDNPQSMLLRYQDLTKLVWTLEHNALYYCQLRQLTDKYEGQVPPAVYESFVQPWQARGLDYSSFSQACLSDFLRSTVYVNCWCMHENESDALWRIYAYPNGVAIRSKYDALAAAADEFDQIGCVTYCDQEQIRSNGTSLVQAAGFKRTYFEFEHEVRLVRMLPPEGEQPPGITVPIDLARIIKGVVVSPYADAWFFNTVQRLLKRYSLDVPVTWSRIR